MTYVRWEGDLTGRHSLAFVNRAIVQGLLKARIRVEASPQPAGPYKLPANVRVAETPGAVDVTVRHGWPPNLSPRHQGKLVFWQPWEYGAVPRSWASFAIETADEVWCYTRYVRECYEDAGVAADKLKVVPLGVDLASFNLSGKTIALPEAGCTFLFVGGTIPRKGIDVLLQGYVEAFSHRDDVLLVVKGFGSQSFYKGSGITDLVEALERARPVAPRLLYIENDMTDSDLAALYRSCDVLVHPYRGEGYGLPVAEALACGKPVITTRGGSTDDFVPADASWQVAATRTTLRPEVLGIPEPAGEAYWLEPDLQSLIASLREAADQPEVRAAKAKAARMQRNQLAWHAGCAAAVERIRSLAQQ